MTRLRTGAAVAASLVALGVTAALTGGNGYSAVIPATTHAHSASQTCAQAPSASAVMRRLGMFYYWREYDAIPNAGKVTCDVR